MRRKGVLLFMITLLGLSMMGCNGSASTSSSSKKSSDDPSYIEITDNSKEVRSSLALQTQEDIKYSFNDSYKRDDLNVKAIEYDGAPYKGEKTNVFAYIGYPSEIKESYPAVVLVHGGGGTAFAEWVKIWNDKGYVAIAMDTEGKRPDYSRGGLGGPDTDCMRNDKGDFKDHWMYHAVSCVIRATTILFNDSKVDKTKIGIVGISWGSVITSIALGCDNRYSFGIPIYGSGFLYDSRSHFSQYGIPDSMFSYYDPSLYFRYYSAKIFYINSDHDPHFSCNITSKSARVNKCNVYFISEHTHGHDTAWAVNETYSFADSITKDDDKLPKLTSYETLDKTIKGTFKVPSDFDSCFLEVYSKNDILEYTGDTINGFIINTDFIQVDAPSRIDSVNGRFEVHVPSLAKLIYVNVVTKKGNISYRVSTPVFDVNNGIPVIEKKVLDMAPIKDWIENINFKDNLDASLDAYLRPYWFSREIYNETIMFVGEEGKCTLMYEPALIHTMKDYRLQEDYVEGVDYKIEGRTITRLKGSKMPYWEYDDYFVTADKIPTECYGTEIKANMSKVDIPFGEQRYLRYGEYFAFTEKQVAISYRHDDVFTGIVPTYQGNKLNNILGKILNKEDSSWMIYGDSVATGCNASGTERGGNISPYMPDAYNLVKLYTEKKYGCSISLENQAVGGWKISECLNAYASKVGGKHVDLMILRIGGNDNQTPEYDYKETLNNLINTFFNDHPSANLIIQTPEMPNQLADDYWTNNIRYNPRWSKEVVETSPYKDQIAISDVQAFTNWVESTGKLTRDSTGNNINHSNDFFIRSYAQILLKTMYGDNYCLEKYKQ